MHRAPPSLLFFFLAALPASAQNNGAASSPPAADQGVAVFAVTAEDPLRETAGRLDAQLTQGLRKAGAPLVDLNAAFPAPTGPGLAAARDAFKAGRAQYDNLDPDAAIAKFQESVNQYLKNPVEVESAALAEAYIWLGASQHMKGDLPAAKDSFGKALLTDPNATVELEVHGQEMLTLLGEVRQSLDSHPKGKLAVDSIPSGARALVKGQDVGVTPVEEQAVPSGPVRVVLIRPGYLPFGTFEPVPAEGQATVKPALEPTPGLATVLNEVMKLTTPAVFGADVLPPESKALGARLSARYLVLAKVSEAGKGKAEVQAWDLHTGNKLKGLTVDVQSGDATHAYRAAEQVTQWIRSPPEPTSEVEVPELARKWWFWAAVGGAAAVVATGVAVSQSGHRPDLVLGTP